MKMLKLEADIGNGLKEEVWVNSNSIEYYWDCINTLTLSNGDSLKLSNESALEFKGLLERGEL